MIYVAARYPYDITNVSYNSTLQCVCGVCDKREIKKKQKWVSPKFFHMKPILINPLVIGKIEVLFKKIRYHIRIIQPQLRYPWKAKKQKKQK